MRLSALLSLLIAGYVDGHLSHPGRLVAIAGHRGPLAAETGEGLLDRVARDIWIVGQECDGAGEGYVLIRK